MAATNDQDLVQNLPQISPELQKNLQNSSDPRVIKRIKFDGLSSMSPLFASDIIKIEPGEILDEKRLNEAIKKLYAQKYFTDILAEFDDNVLHFHFVEKPRAQTVKITGFGSEEEREKISKTLAVKRGEVFDEESIKATKNTLNLWMESQGFYGNVIDVTRKKIDKNVYALTFEANAGQNIFIKNIVFDGAKSLEIQDLQELSANKQRQSMPFLWFRNDGKLRIRELPLDTQRIQHIYAKNGFLDANVSQAHVMTNFFNSTAALHYKITEGVRYKIAKITIDQEGGEIVPNDDLMKKILSKQGDFANIEKMQNDVQILKIAISEHAYAFTQVQPDIENKNLTEKTVDLVFHISPGEKIKIRDVIVTGNTRTQDRVIRREILLAPGDFYSGKKILASKNALQRLGFFEGVEIDEKRVSADSMDLIVRVDESGRTGELQFGAGLGSGQGFTANASVKERNLFGTGQTGSVNLNYANGEKRDGKRVGQNFSASVALSNPRIFDTLFSTGGNISWSKSTQAGEETERYGFSANVGRTIFEDFFDNAMNLFVSYDFSVQKKYGFTSPLYERYSRSTNFRVSPSPAVPCSMQNANKTSSDARDICGIWERFRLDFNDPVSQSLSFGVSFDNTNDFYFPRSGIIASISTDFTVFGEHFTHKTFTLGNYTSLNARISLYQDLRPTTGLDLIARLKLRGSSLFRPHRDAYLPLSATYSLGGVGTVRGLENGAISPVDEYGVRIGGDGMASASAELSFSPFEREKMRFAIFTDIGLLKFRGIKIENTYKWCNSVPLHSVKNCAKNDIKRNQQEILVGNFLSYGLRDPKNTKFYPNSSSSAYTEITWRASAGFSVEWISPLGPLELIFAPIHINHKIGDQTSFFEFNIGAKF